MSLLRRIALVIKSRVADFSDRLDRVAAEEELRRAESTPRAESASHPPPTVPSHQADQLASDYGFLGLEPGADLEAVAAAWRNLAARADPKRFPAGSDEEKKAAQILKSLNAAYSRLRESVNPTEGRFGQLEL